MKKGRFASIARTLLLVTVGLIPLGQFERLELHSGTAIYFHEVTLALLVVVYVVSHAKAIAHWLPHSRLALLAGVLLGWIAVTSLLHLHQSPTLLLVSLLYEARFALYLVGLGTVASLVREQIVSPRLLRRLLIGAIALVAVFGLLQYVFIPDTRFLMFLGWDDHYLRLISTLFDPGFTGALLVVGALLASVRGDKKQTLLWFLCAGALLLTYSRASFLAYGVGTLGLFIWKREKRLLLFLLLFCVAIPFLPRPRSEGTRLERTASIVARVNTFEASTSKRSVLDTLSGYGWYHQKQTQERQMDDYSIPSHNSAPENSLLFIYDSLGVIGLGLFALLGVRLLQACNWNGEVMIIGGALVVHSLFSNTLFYPFVMLTFVVLMGCRLRESL